MTGQPPEIMQDPQMPVSGQRAFEFTDPGTANGRANNLARGLKSYWESSPKTEGGATDFGQFIGNLAKDADLGNDIKSYLEHGHVSDTLKKVVSEAAPLHMQKFDPEDHPTWDWINDYIAEPIANVGYGFTQGLVVDPVIGLANLAGAGLQHVDVKAKAQANFRRMFGTNNANRYSDTELYQQQLAANESDSKWDTPQGFLKNTGNTVGHILSYVTAGGTVAAAGKAGKVATTASAAGKVYAVAKAPLRGSMAAGRAIGEIASPVLELAAEGVQAGRWALNGFKNIEKFNTSEKAYQYLEGLARAMGEFGALGGLTAASQAYGEYGTLPGAYNPDAPAAKVLAYDPKTGKPVIKQPSYEDAIGAAASGFVTSALLAPIAHGAGKLGQAFFANYMKRTIESAQNNLSLNGKILNAMSSWARENNVVKLTSESTDQFARRIVDGYTKAGAPGSGVSFQTLFAGGVQGLIEGLGMKASDAHFMKEAYHAAHNHDWKKLYSLSLESLADPIAFIGIHTGHRFSDVPHWQRINVDPWDPTAAIRERVQRQEQTEKVVQQARAEVEAETKLEQDQQRQQQEQQYAQAREARQSARATRLNEIEALNELANAHKDVHNYFADLQDTSIPDLHPNDLARAGFVAHVNAPKRTPAGEQIPESIHYNRQDTNREQVRDKLAEVVKEPITVSINGASAQTLIDRGLVPGSHPAFGQLKAAIENGQGQVTLDPQIVNKMAERVARQAPGWRAKFGVEVAQPKLDQIDQVLNNVLRSAGGSIKSEPMPIEPGHVTETRDPQGIEVSGEVFKEPTYTQGVPDNARDIELKSESTVEVYPLETSVKVEIPQSPYSFEIKGGKAFLSIKLADALGLPKEIPASDVPKIEKAALVSALQSKTQIPGHVIDARTGATVNGDFQEVIRFGELVRRPNTLGAEWKPAEYLPREEGQDIIRAKDNISEEQKAAVQQLLLAKNRTDLKPEDQAVLDATIIAMDSIAAERDPAIAQAVETVPVLAEAIHSGDPEHAGIAIKAAAKIATSTDARLAIQEYLETVESISRPKQLELPLKEPIPKPMEESLPIAKEGAKQEEASYTGEEPSKQSLSGSSRGKGVLVTIDKQGQAKVHVYESYDQAKKMQQALTDIDSERASNDQKEYFSKILVGKGETGKSIQSIFDEIKSAHIKDRPTKVYRWDKRASEKRAREKGSIMSPVDMAIEVANLINKGIDKVVDIAKYLTDKFGDTSFSAMSSSQQEKFVSEIKAFGGDTSKIKDKFATDETASLGITADGTASTMVRGEDITQPRMELDPEAVYQTHPEFNADIENALDPIPTKELSAIDAVKASGRSNEFGAIINPVDVISAVGSGAATVGKATGKAIRGVARAASEPLIFKVKRVLGEQLAQDAIKATGNANIFSTRIKKAGAHELARMNRDDIAPLEQLVVHPDDPTIAVSLYTAIADAGNARAFGFALPMNSAEAALVASLTPKQQRALELSQQAHYEGAKIAEEIGLPWVDQPTQKNKNAPKTGITADPERQIVIRELTKAGADALSCRAGPVWEALVNFLKKHGGPEAQQKFVDFLDNGRVRVSASDNTETRRWMSFFPSQFLIGEGNNARWVRFLEDRPRELMQRMLATTPRILGTKSVFRNTANDVPKPITNQYPSIGGLPDIITKVYQTKANGNASDVQVKTAVELSRSLFGMPAQEPIRVGSGTLNTLKAQPGTRLYDLITFAGQMRNLRQRALLTFAAIGNTQEALTKAAQFGWKDASKTYATVLSKMGNLPALHNELLQLEKEGYIELDKDPYPATMTGREATAVALRMTGDVLAAPHDYTQDAVKVTTASLIRDRLQEMQAGNGNKQDMVILRRLGFDDATMNRMINGSGTEAEYAAYKARSLSVLTSDSITPLDQSGLSRNPYWIKLTRFTRYPSSQASLLYSESANVARSLAAGDVAGAATSVKNIGYSMLGMTLAGTISRGLLSVLFGDTDKFAKEFLPKNDEQSGLDYALQLTKLGFKNMAAGGLGGMYAPIGAAAKAYSSAATGNPIVNIIAGAAQATTFVGDISQLFALLGMDHPEYRACVGFPDRLATFFSTNAALIRRSREGFFGAAALSLDEWFSPITGVHVEPNIRKAKIMAFEFDDEYDKKHLPPERQREKKAYIAEHTEFSRRISKAIQLLPEQVNHPDDLRSLARRVLDETAKASADVMETQTEDIQETPSNRMYRIYSSAISAFENKQILRGWDQDKINAAVRQLGKENVVWIQKHDNILDSMAEALKEQRKSYDNPYKNRK